MARSTSLLGLKCFVLFVCLLTDDHLLATPISTTTHLDKPPFNQFSQLDGQLKDTFLRKHSAYFQNHSENVYGRPNHLPFYSGTGLSGNVVFTARKLCRLKFTIPQRLIESPKVLLKASLHLYKKGFTVKRFSKKYVRITIYQVNRYQTTPNFSRPVGKKVIRAGRRGWINYKIKSVILKLIRNLEDTLRLDVWMESIEGGKQSIKTNRLIKIVKQRSTKSPRQKPRLKLLIRKRKTY